MSNPDVSKIFEGCLRLFVTAESGILLQNSSAIVNYSTNDPVQCKSRSFSKYYNTHFPMAQSTISSYSSTRNLRLVFQEGKTKEEQFLEIWNNQRIIQVKNVAKSHSVCTNHPVFGKIV